MVVVVFSTGIGTARKYIEEERITNEIAKGCYQNKESSYRETISGDVVVSVLHS